VEIKGMDLILVPAMVGGRFCLNAAIALQGVQTRSEAGSAVAKIRQQQIERMVL
jgi:hypothetical protein